MAMLNNQRVANIYIWKIQEKWRVLLGNLIIHGGFSIAMFDCRRVVVPEMSPKMGLSQKSESLVFFLAIKQGYPLVN